MQYRQVPLQGYPSELGSACAALFFPWIFQIAVVDLQHGYVEVGRVGLPLIVTFRYICGNIINVAPWVDR